MIDLNGVFCVLSWKPSRKYDILEIAYFQTVKD